MANYLRRQAPINPSYPSTTLPNDRLLRIVKRDYKDWPLTDTAYFKTGDHNNLLDWGVSRGEIEKFLKMCAGIDNSGQAIRPVDLILFGHVHTRVEMRLKWDPNKKELQYFNDFYTENPLRYYSSRKYKNEYGGYDRVYIRLSANATPNGRVGRISDDFWGSDLQLLIPTYPNPLNQSENPAQWWQQHRPLFIQGAPLGPTDNNQRRDKTENKHRPDPSFEGCKLIVVRNDTIKKIIQISRHELDKDTWELPRGVSAPAGILIPADSPEATTVKTNGPK